MAQQPQAGGQQAAAAGQPNPLAALIGNLANEAVLARADAAARHEAQTRKEEKKKFLDIEAGKIDKCSGTPEKSMRRWARDVIGAMTRVPLLQAAQGAQPGVLAQQQALVNNELGLGLFAKTANGDLIREIDRHHSANPNDDTLAIVNAMEMIFLGADEPAAKQAVLKTTKQLGGPRTENGIPAYARQFCDLADEAYVVAQRNPDVEQELCDLFITSLHSKAVSDELFSTTPLSSHCWGHETPPLPFIIVIAVLSARGRDVDNRKGPRSPWKSVHSSNRPCRSGYASSRPK